MEKDTIYDNVLVHSNNIVTKHNDWVKQELKQLNVRQAVQLPVNNAVWKLLDQEIEQYKHIVLTSFTHYHPFSHEMGNFLIALIRLTEIDDIKTLIAYYVNISNGQNLLWTMIYRNSFVHLWSYAVPSQQAITQIVEWFHMIHKTNSNTKLVDFGCGSGLFSLLFVDAGIPKDSVIAVDLPENKTTHKFGRVFYDNIVRTNNFCFSPNDVLFIAWGSCGTKIVDEFVTKGGTKCILLGEWDGATWPAGDQYENDPNWSVTSIRVPGSVRELPCGGDVLSLNIRRTF